MPYLNDDPPDIRIRNGVHADVIGGDLALNRIQYDANSRTNTSRCLKVTQQNIFMTIMRDVVDLQHIAL